ncbi:MAG: peptidyl-prolyl cis-trans isomerase [Pseudomonadales bacterium]
MRALRRALQEPLLYFLLVGAGLFVVAERFGGEGDQRILVSNAEVARISDQWQAQMGRPPNENELAALIEQWIREEIYYREARALGLDENDVIVRRRLAQKLAFLGEDLNGNRAADEQTLRAYHADHAERYAEPERFTFTHRYFSSDRRERAHADALAALADGSEGDPFMLRQRYVERSQREIGELFGREFAAALRDLTLGDWRGPVASAYGWHLIHLEGRQPSRPLGFDEVAQRVALDHQQEQRQRASETFYQSLRERYEIVIP